MAQTTGDAGGGSLGVSKPRFKGSGYKVGNKGAPAHKRAAAKAPRKVAIPNALNTSRKGGTHPVTTSVKLQDARAQDRGFKPKVGKITGRKPPMKPVKPKAKPIPMKR